MGYELHITRRNNWFDEDASKEIRLDEWKEYINTDSEMRLDNYAKATTSEGQVISTISEGISVWLGYSKNGIDGNYAWFNYSAGNISVKNPDKEIIQKMFQIAKRLGTAVQGDDGEFYGSNASEIINASKVEPSVKISKKAWWKFW